jgi:predicted ATP-dependent endonuclease of OLD family
VAELSDGERNAFLLAAEVLTAKPGTLLIIDEPERHLHRSIISPLLKLLCGRRRDCAFIVSTHELMLATDTTDASTMLVRGCEYDGQNVRSWAVDLLASVAAIDEELRHDVLGARRKILFVEGTAQSRDAPLYSLLFPHVSIVPKKGCREVEYAVRGLRGAPDMHWINAWGIVDNDQRSAENIARLREGHIWALSHYSVESLHFHPKIVARVAERQSQLIGGDPTRMMRAAIERAVNATLAQKEHLIASAVLRQVRRQISECLPTRDDMWSSETVKVEVDLAALRVDEEVRFDLLVDAG